MSAYLAHHQFKSQSNANVGTHHSSKCYRSNDRASSDPCDFLCETIRLRNSLVEAIRVRKKEY